MPPGVETIVSPHPAQRSGLSELDGVFLNLLREVV
jgi:hypothetical protein